MTKIILQKEGAFLVPFDVGAEEWYQAQVNGMIFTADIVKPRNYLFLKKYFELLNKTYPYWQPAQKITKYGVVERDFEHYRESLIIMAGHYKQVFSVGGSFILKAESISFAKMEETEFNVFYDKTTSVIIREVLIDWTIEQVDNLVGSFL